MHYSFALVGKTVIFYHVLARVLGNDKRFSAELPSHGRQTSIGFFGETEKEWNMLPLSSNNACNPTLATHDATHLVIARDTVETWRHLASAALLLMPHHAAPEDSAPPFGCMLAVLASLFVIFLGLVMGHVFRCSS
jgi:hypothetical protein